MALLSIRKIVLNSQNTMLVRALSSSNYLQSNSIDANFEAAKQQLNSFSKDPGNETKLKIYALFKQATVGKNTTAKPGALNFVGQYKWSAWSDLGEMSKDEAKQSYIDLVTELAKAEGGNGSSVDCQTQQETETDTKVYGSSELLVKIENQIMTVTLNRPERYNALLSNMYDGIAKILSDAANDDSVSIVVLTGAGKYFCSGNDLKNFDGISPANMKERALLGAEVLERYVASFIDFPKPLVAAVNGPAIGIPVTQLGLFDAVYASDKATFQTPFSEIGQSPEACSSYIFPKLMGHSKACTFLLFNETYSASEAERLNLVTKVFSHATFQDDVKNQVESMSQLPLKSLIYSKRLARDYEREILHKVNKAECERLIERWTSEDCIKAVMGFLSKL